MQLYFSEEGKNMGTIRPTQQINYAERQIFFSVGLFCFFSFLFVFVVFFLVFFELGFFVVFVDFLFVLFLYVVVAVLEGEGGGL